MLKRQLYSGDAYYGIKNNRCFLSLLPICLLLTVQNIFSQSVTEMQNKIHHSGIDSLSRVDSLSVLNYFYFPVGTACKAALIRKFTYPAEYDTVPVVRLKQPFSLPAVVPGKKLLTVRGNILYDVNYRSNIDTPYAEKNVYQHTVQTYLDITWKDSYPFRVYFTRRFGNSPFFRNYSDVNLQFNPTDFRSRIKQQLIATIMKSIKLDTLLAVKKMLDEKRNELDGLQNWVSNPAQIQKIVEERERRAVKMPVDLPAGNSAMAFAAKGKAVPEKFLLKQSLRFRQALNADSLKQGKLADTLKNKYEGIEARYTKTKEHIDSLNHIIKKLDSSYHALKLLQYANTDKLKREIAGIQTVSGLRSKLQELHMADTVLPKGYNTLFALQSLGIGRSIADYSELSVKNISINGFQAVYMPRYYYAVAVGSVDYRFRDYIIYNNNQQKQWLALVTAGKGEKESNHIHLTYYTGRRQLYNSATTLNGNTIPNYNLMGLTIETRWQLNRNSFITAELAKSSLPYYSLDSTKRASLISNVTKMNDRSNEAYSLKLNSFIPRTQTTITALYRHAGANFQSFSLFTSGSAQTAWSVKINQPFFRQGLTVVAGIRENDFTNSFTNTAYQTNTVLKSIQATLRMKKWPVVSLGYFPSAQLTKLGDNRYSENLFYTLVGSASHFYSIHKKQFSSTLVFTRFYNASSDSGFVYFNARNWLLSQTAFLGKLTLLLNMSAATNTNYQLLVLEEHTTLAISKWLSAGVGVKYNRQTRLRQEQWGYAGSMKIKIPVLGEIQMSYDKGFIPGSNNQLVENTMARLTYFKTF